MYTLIYPRSAELWAKFATIVGADMLDQHEWKDALEDLVLFAHQKAPSSGLLTHSHQQGEGPYTDTDLQRAGSILAYVLGTQDESIQSFGTRRPSASKPSGKHDANNVRLSRASQADQERDSRRGLLASESYAHTFTYPPSTLGPAVQWGPKPPASVSETRPLTTSRSTSDPKSSLSCSPHQRRFLRPASWSVASNLDLVLEDPRAEASEHEA